MSKVTRVGVDLAKNVIQVHAVDAAGKVVTSRALKRERFLHWCAELPEGCLVVVLTRFHGHMRALGFRPEWGGVWGDYRQCMPAQRVRSSR